MAKGISKYGHLSLASKPKCGVILLSVSGRDIMEWVAEIVSAVILTL